MFHNFTIHADLCAASTYLNIHLICKICHISLEIYSNLCRIHMHNMQEDPNFILHFLLIFYIDDFFVYNRKFHSKIYQI